MGSIRKRGDKYFAEVCINRKRQGKTFRLKTQAKAWISEVEDNGFSSNMKLIELLDRYLDEVSTSKKGYKWEKDRINVLRRHRIASERLSRITATNILDWKNDRLNRVKPASVNREWNLLSAVFSKGVQWELLTKNPMKGVERPDTTKPRKRIFTQDEIESIKEECTPKMSAIFTLALETGMRLGEICAMQWEDVKDKHVHIPETKNGHDREVPLSKAARDVLPERGEGSVFNISSDSASTLFRRARIEAGVTDATFHDSRRTALTEMAKRMPVETLAKISGHRDLRILLNTYYAPTVEDLTKYFD
jgi:integrase